MTGPLRNCGKPECRLCNRARPVEDDPESLATALLGAAAIVGLFVLLFVILPVL